jgi:hypothetical protein
MITYRFTQVVFGVSCSPFVLIKHYLQKYHTTYPNTVDLISCSIYVEDINYGADKLTASM